MWWDLVRTTGLESPPERDLVETEGRRRDWDVPP